MEGRTVPQSEPVTLQGATAANGDRHGSTASPPSSTSLRSVRKPPAKPWKKPAAPPTPQGLPGRPRGFRQLVQRLTGAPELAPRRLRDAAPAPLELVVPRPFAQPPQQTEALPMQEYLLDGASLTSFHSMPDSTHGYSSAEVAATMAAPPQQMNATLATSSRRSTRGIPSPSLYSAYVTWCNLPLLSPGSMACLEQSTVL